jgi:hypothetical protein
MVVGTVVPPDDVQDLELIARWDSSCKMVLRDESAVAFCESHASGWRLSLLWRMKEQAWADLRKYNGWKSRLALTWRDQADCRLLRPAFPRSPATSRKHRYKTWANAWAAAAGP